MLRLTLFFLVAVNAIAHDGLPIGPVRAQADKARLTETQEKFLSKLFPNVGLRTIQRRYSGSLRSAVDRNPIDDALLSQDIAELMNTLAGDAGVESVYFELQTERQKALDAGIENETVDKKWISLLDRFLWAAYRLKGTIPLESDTAKHFSDLFITKFHEVDKKMALVREAVENGNSSFLRDPKNLDHEALTTHLANSKDRVFAGQLGKLLGWDNQLYLKGNDGKFYSFDLGDDPGKALFEMKAVPGTESAAVATTRGSPEMTWHFDNGKWNEGPRQGTRSTSDSLETTRNAAQGILLRRCVGCHHTPAKISSWNAATVLRRITSTDLDFRMPFQKDPLPPEEISIIRSWANSIQ